MSATLDADAVLGRLRDEGFHSVRVVFADQHGLLRGKTVAAEAMAGAFEHGVGLPGSLLHKDTGNNYAVGLWEPTGDETLDQLVGARNIIMRPDASTFRPLPWLAGTGLVLSDVETTEGEPIALSTRAICRQALERLAGHGLRYKAGLEFEFHLFRREPTGELRHSHPGWDLLGEDSLDRLEPAVEPIRQGLTDLGLAPATIEAELGPSQIELTFPPAEGLVVADQAVIIRSAIRQLARRNGHQATFMSRPMIDGQGFPSGWHLHQSLVAADNPSGPSLFMPTPDTPAAGSPEHTVDGGAGAVVSALGGQVIAGLLANAEASCLLTTPTVTGYKRYRPRAVTPDRISWSREHRGAMLRVIGGAGDPATRIENRAGDPAANPYLYVGSQVLSALDGIEHEMAPPPPTESPYGSDGGRLLPRHLGEAIDAFDTSAVYRKALGDVIVDYLVTLKRSEWQRFNATVTDWEQNEYRELF